MAMANVRMVNVMKKILAALTFVAAAVLAAPGAHAFTFENSAGPHGSGGSSLADPGDQLKASGSPSTAKGDSDPGDSGLRFSVGPASPSGNRPNTLPPAWVGNPLFLDKGNQ
jgi:hypothetical protein